MTGTLTNLTHFLGFATGAALYAMLLWVAVQSRRAGARPDALPLLTGVLGLIWNIGSLGAHTLSDPSSLATRVITAISYAALGFLPAVVVHSVLRSDAREGRAGLRRLIQLAYGFSAAGMLLQFHATLWSGTSSQSSLRYLTAAFVAIAVPLLIVTRRQGYARGLWIASLAIFAVSGFHMSTRHIGSYPWPLELVGHHASLPLAFAILFFDYRFAFADLFLKRGVALVALIVVVAVAVFGIPIVFGLNDLTHPAAIGAVVSISVVATLLYPLLRRKIDGFVDRIILRRTNYADLRQDLNKLASTTDEVETLLQQVCTRLQEANVARGVTWVELEAAAGHEADHVIVSGDEHTLRIPVTESPRYSIVFRAFHGGRRLLSDDLAFLEAVALIIARRIDSLRLLRERIVQGAREQEMSKLTTEAELRALRAQMNPHFLFNALNTIGYLIRTAPERAFETLLLLTGLLRRVLRSSEPFVVLEDELKIVEAYLEIERARFEERLRVAIRVSRDAQKVRIPTLLLQPLVENAIKHGISNQRHGGEVTIEAEVEQADGRPYLCLRVRDTGAGTSEHALRRRRRDGVGLTNIEERLRAHYQGDASLTIDSAPNLGTVVTVVLPVEPMGHSRSIESGA